MILDAKFTESNHELPCNFDISVHTAQPPAEPYVGDYDVVITENNKTTALATAGKYCEKNITVTATIDEKPIREEGIAIGIDQGRKAEYDAFWDAFQNFGNRTDYDRAFKGEGWNEVTYNPKYIPKPVNASFMYQQSGVVGRVDVDTSNCTAMDGMFGNSKSITSIGTIDTRKNANIQQAGIFGYMDKLENIDLLILKDDGSQTFSTSCFYGDSYLKEIRIQGKIGNSLNLVQCYRLSKESITSIVNALSDDASGMTLTLSQFVKKYLTDAEWTALTGTKQNWTISFA